MGWQYKSLFWGGICANCGRDIGQSEKGWHSKELVKVRCSYCGPPRTPHEGSGRIVGVNDRGSAAVETKGADNVEGSKSLLREDPIGGTAALREAQSKRDVNWLKGATGEYLMDKALHKHLNKDAIILTDRRVPGTQANIDHVVITSSGIWVIDSKNWGGRVQYKQESYGSSTMLLIVGGEDRTWKVRSIYGQILPIAQIVGRGIPIEPAVALVDADWSIPLLPRLLFKKPLKNGEVWIGPPQILIRAMNKPGSLDLSEVQRLGKVLDDALEVR